MATDDQQILVAGQAATPATFTIPGNGQITPRSVFAHFDGSGAAAAFRAALKVTSDGGKLVGIYPCSTTIAAGGSAEVSWFPEVADTTEILPPFTQGTWQRVAEPLISPTVGWEGPDVAEPSVHFESPTWKMWYSAGGTNAGIGYATCTGDPTVPGNWVKNAGNPVLGQGGSGIAGFAARPDVLKVAGTYQMFYSDVAGGGNLKRSTSADGITWNAPATAIASGAVGGVSGWANSVPYFDGTSWFMFVMASIGAGPVGQWAPYLFKNTAISNDGGWVVQNGGAALTSLQVASYDNGYGQAASIAEIDGAQSFQVGAPYVLWCHASKSTNPISSDIMHATSADPTHVSWNPASTFDLIHNGTAFESTQVFAPRVLQVAGKSYLFFSGENANTLVGFINLATFDGTLVQFLNGSQGGGTITNITSADSSVTVTNPTGPTVDLHVATGTGITTLASPASTITVTNPNGPTADVDLPTTGVGAASYGDGSHVGSFTVDSRGRLTAASSVAITGGSSTIGFEIDYVTQTTDLTVTATSAATAQTFLDGNAVTYDGSTRIKLEFWSPNVSNAGGGVTICELYDGASDLNRLGQGTANSPFYVATFLTPTAAAHTYHIKFWRATSNGLVEGNGGGIFFPAFYRITKA